MPLNRDALAVLIGRMEETRKSRDDFDRRLRLAGIEAELEAGRLGYNVQTGQLEPRTVTPFDPSSLRTGERAHIPLPGGGYRIYEGPPGGDQSLAASRLGSLMKTMQDIELINEEQRARARPASQGFFGIGARPAVEPRLFDTSALQSAVGQLQSQFTRPSAAPAVTTPALHGVGSLALPGADLEEEVADLIAGIQQGLIQSRQQAEQVILQAGLDPNDPAFASVLQQLP